MPSEDRLALVPGPEEAEEEPEREEPVPISPPSPSSTVDLPWVCAMVYRRPPLPPGAGRLAALSALLVALSALLLVQLALLRDASRAAGVGAYPAAAALSLVTLAAAAPAAAVALWRGGRPAAPGRLSVAAALCSVGSLLVLAGRHQNRLGCNVQDPLVAVVIVFAFMGHLLTASKVRLRSTIAQVVVCLGLFIGVSYQACNKYSCHGNDHSGSWRSAGVAAREQHVLWVAVGASGLAMVCSACMVLESHFHSQSGKGGQSSWWDDMASTGLMTTASFVTVSLLFWVDLVPGVGESESVSDLGSGLVRALAALGDQSPVYRRACLLIGMPAPL
ncbi:hypothetical protein FJT64_020039 [Amphibalanus amphitrite]|uniref:Uncharacterized protein n=1 Tax=Amphibalanus amphitrite TaxID=1232801 RepID=A0A6A4WY88_AMPAM|nr:hypothetical protein FJT64_020039 [Amphibalanus amphitrite]